MNIIEVINGKGVKTTNHALAHIRLSTPKPGDVVRFADGLPYPFKAEYGRVSGEYMGGEDHTRTTICCNGGSVFLNNDGSVSISGGPFEGVDIAHLKPLYTLQTVRFWNWGDNQPGASQGVEYYIPRPVFLYQPPGIIPARVYFQSYGDRRIFVKDVDCAIKQIKELDARREEGRKVTYAELVIDNQAVHISRVNGEWKQS